MTSAHLRVAFVLLGALFALSACGGGGGGSGPGGSSGPPTQSPTPNLPLRITVSQNPITASIAQIDLPAEVTFGATVQGTTSANLVYVVITDPSGTFVGTTPVINQISLTEYQATLIAVESLSMGSHTGALDISICADPACATALGKTTAPYAISVTENPVLTGSWQPSAFAVTSISGDQQADWPVRFTAPATKHSSLYARLSDSGNIVSVSGSAQTIRVNSFQPVNEIAIAVPPTVPPGTYNGNLDIVFCRDEACTHMYRGVTQLPYTISVVPTTNLKTLVPLSGAQDWQTVQGNAAHTGYVPVTLNPQAFSPRWLWHTPNPTTLPELLDPVTTDGKVFTVAAPDATLNITPVLVALDEATGSIAWQKDIPDNEDSPTSLGLGGFTSPVIAGAAVYVARTVYTYPQRAGAFEGFNVSNGTPRFARQPLAAYPGTFYDYFYEPIFGLRYAKTPYLTPINGSILLNVIDDNYNRSFVTLDQGSGAAASIWDTCAETRASTLIGGAVAIDANQNAYLATEGGLLNPYTCQLIASSVPINDGAGPTVVPGTDDVVVLGSGNLVSFDTVASQVNWTVTSVPAPADNFVGSPAIAGTVLYVQNNNSFQLEARRVSDGQILWVWKPTWSDETAFVGNVIATQNLVFVSTRKRTYAIDLATQQTVWTYPYHGKLALSANGILYVQRGGPMLHRNGLAAINLH